jgi:hypothetical protein
VPKPSQEEDCKAFDADCVALGQLHSTKQAARGRTEQRRIAMGFVAASRINCHTKKRAQHHTGSRSGRTRQCYSYEGSGDCGMLGTRGCL